MTFAVSRGGSLHEFHLLRNKKIISDSPKIESGLNKMIRMGKSNRHIWVKSVNQIKIGKLFGIFSVV